MGILQFVYLSISLIPFKTFPFPPKMLSDLSIEAGSIDRLSVLGRECLFVGSSLTGFLAADIVQSLPVASTFVIVSDHNVAPLHLSLLVSAVQEALNEASAKSPVATSSSVASGSKTPRILTFLIPPGEASKTRETKAQIEDYMLANKCTRDTVMIALGGGVIGDLAGILK